MYAHISAMYVGTGILEMGTSMYMSVLIGKMCIGMQGSMHGCLCVDMSTILDTHIQYTARIPIV